MELALNETGGPEAPRKRFPRQVHPALPVLLGGR